jgi:transcriptional regulator with XRE-family HTH domain
MKADDINMIVGRRIAQLRRAKGMTQLQLAAATGISQANISLIERGERPMNVATLGRLLSEVGGKLAIEPRQ